MYEFDKHKHRCWMENSTMNIDECPIKNGGTSSQLCLLEAILSCYGSVLHSQSFGIGRRSVEKLVIKD